MLSAIVYGRNDGYSYELNRRTALGLNQLAQQLIVGRDEIMFVDYNTDNDLPTHPEAIADTLTDRAKGPDPRDPRQARHPRCADHTRPAGARSCVPQHRITTPVGYLILSTIDIAGQGDAAFNKSHQ